MTKGIYLDNAAATPIFPEVAEMVKSVSTDYFGNPSSTHSFGERANKLLEQSTTTVAQFLNCQNSEVVFTGSGTESNNLALIGVAKANKNRGNHIITSAIEHPSILNACKSLEKDGFKVTYLPVGPDGLITVGDLEKSLTKQTILVSIHLANSEIGVIQPIKELAKLTKKHGVYFHSDACQAAAYLPLEVQKLGVDLLSFNGSKCYGPRGVAVLYVKNSTEIFPIHFGGGQQQGLRSGTENLAGIAGLATSLKIITDKRDEQSIRLEKLRDELAQKLEEAGAVINVKTSLRLPNHLSAIMPIDETDLVKYFGKKGVAVSSGSACSSKSLVESHVLQAIGLTSDQIQKTIRISLGYQSTTENTNGLFKAL